MKKTHCFKGVLIVIIVVLFNIIRANAQSVKTEHVIKFENWMSPTNSISLSPSAATLGQWKLILPPELPALGNLLQVSNVAGNDAQLSWLMPNYITTSGFLGDASTFVGTTNSSPLKFYTNNTERMRITETGTVGIGTNSPSSTFEVSGAGHSILTAPATAISSDNLEANQVSASLDETNDRIELTAKESGGTTIIGKTLKKVIYHVANFDCPSLRSTNDYRHIENISIPGAEVGDIVIVTPNFQLPSYVVIISAWVSSAGVVSIKFSNVMEYVLKTPATSWHDPIAMNYYILLLR